MDNINVRHVLFNLYTWGLILVDPTIHTCTSLFGLSINVAHQYICSAVILLGPLYNLYLYNILLVILVWIGWQIFGSCLVTVITNRLCGDYDLLPFHNIAFYIKAVLTPYVGLDLTDNLHAGFVDYPILYSIIIYNLFMLYRTYRKH